MNKEQSSAQLPLPHLLPQISLLSSKSSPTRVIPFFAWPRSHPPSHTSGPALSSVNPGGLQGSDELPPAAAVLINADPRSAGKWEAEMPAALVEAQGKQ